MSDLPIVHGVPKTKTKQSLRTVGLFSGIGGLELGLQKAGHCTLMTCEVDQSAAAVLKARMGHRNHDDIQTLKRVPRGTDMVVGGFPCQDLSQAGRTKGIEGSRSGLVGEVFRLLRTSNVPWVVLENVPFMLQLSRGQALDVIVTTLESMGYSWAYRVVDSRAFGLPQRRRRVLFVASKVEDPRTVLFADDESPQEAHDFHGRACGFYWTEGRRGLGWAVDAIPTLKGGSTIGVPSPPAIWLPDGGIVTPDIRDAERLQGFRPNWTRPAEEVGRASFRWKLVGNAVSVPVAAWLGKRLARPQNFEVDGVTPVQTGKSWPTNAWNVGSGRFTCSISEWPITRERPPLEDFLKYPPKPLSLKATNGFLNRLRESGLRFPQQFLKALEKHLRAQEANVA